MYLIPVGSVAISSLAAVVALFSDRLKSIRRPAVLQDSNSEQVHFEILQSDGRVVSVSGEVSSEDARKISDIIEKPMETEC